MEFNINEVCCANCAREWSDEAFHYCHLCGEETGFCHFKPSDGDESPNES